MAAGASGIRAGRAYVELGADLTKLESGLRRAQQKVAAFGQGIQSAGTGLAKLGVGIGVPLALGAAAFANFEQAMARVKALTGATEPEFAALNAEAKRLGLDTVFSARQAAETMGVFGLAGLNAKEIIAALAPTLDTAAAGQMDLAQAADIALKTMKSMGYAATDTRMILDVMGKAMVTANTDLIMLGDAFKFVGPIARAAGLSLQETTATIQLLSDAGIQAEMAGTTLRGAILSLTSPSVEAKAKLKQLGIEVNDGAGNFRGMIEIIRDLERATAGMGTGKKLETLGLIFPARSAAGMATLLSEGSDKLAEYTKRLGDAGGTTARIAATQLDTLKGSATLVMSSIEGLGIAIGGTLAPALRGAAELFTLVLNRASQWTDANPELYRTILGVSVGAITLGSSLFALGAGIKIVAFGMGGLTIGFTVAKTAIGLFTGTLGLALAAAKVFGAGIVIVITGVAAAVKAVMAGTAAFSALTGVMAAAFNPILLVTTAAGAGLILTLGGITYALGKILITSDRVSAAVSTLTDGFRSVAGTAVTAWKGIEQAVKAGNLESAFSIAMAGLRLEWAKLMLSMKSMWLEFTGWISSGRATSDLKAGSILLAGKLAAALGMKGSAKGDATKFEGGKDFVGPIDPLRENKEQLKDAQAQFEAQANAPGMRNAALAIYKGFGSASKNLLGALSPTGMNKNAMATLGGFKTAGLGIAENLFPGLFAKQVPKLNEIPLPKGEVQGTFSGAVAGLLGGKSSMEKLADAVRDQGKTLDRIEANTRESGRTV